MIRSLLVASVMLCSGLSFVGASAQAADSTMDPVAKEECIKACNDCVRACRECLHHCGCPACEKTCLTCIETCRTCVALMEFDSPLAKEMCRVCEEACKQCCEECEKCSDSPHAKKCSGAGLKAGPTRLGIVVRVAGTVQLGRRQTSDEPRYAWIRQDAKQAPSFPTTT